MHSPGSGLRRLTILLVILNLGVLLAGWGGTVWKRQGPALVTYNADKIQLLEDVLPAKPAEPTVEDPMAEAQEIAQALPPCPAWASLDADGIAQVQAYLRQAGVADADYDLLVEMRLGWWVYIPPLENAAALQVVMEDARAKGVKDMAPVRSGSMFNALALGTFPTLEGARRHAQDMTRKGLREVRYAPRPGAGAIRLVVVKDSSAMQRALSGTWPVGLEPKACKPE